jgi:hypothetical protein
MIAACAVLVVGGGIALAVLLSSGGAAPPSSRSAPPAPTVPSHNAPSSPPWGFTGSGWSDYCYRTTATAPGYTQEAVPDTQPCPRGATRITGMTQIGLTAQAGADVDRLGTSWGSIEPRAPGQPLPPGQPRFNWEPLVQRYRAMLRNGIQPVVLAMGTPTWARMPGWDRPGTCSTPGGTCAFPPAPQHIAEWRTFLRGLMVHLPRMRALEVWNEPNSAHFFAPKPSPALYAKMLRAADQAAQQVGFKRPIITAGLAPDRPHRSAKMPPAQFLTRVYELDGASAFDGIGTHPYPAGPPWVANMTANLNQLRAVRRHFHDGGKPLWITEVGLGGTPGGQGHFAVPLAEQGPILTRMYRSVQGSDVRSFIIFNLFDSNHGGRFGAYGVVGPTLTPKPAYCYLARHVGHSHACPAAGP